MKNRAPFSGDGKQRLLCRTLREASQKGVHGVPGFLRRQAAAEDATQETFLHAYQKIHSFQGGNFSRLAHADREECLHRPVAETPSGSGNLTDELLSEGAAVGAMDRTPDLHLMVEEVWKEMAFLPPDQRRCLEMKIQGYSYEETAARTGLSIDAVKSHLQNGRRMLWLKTKGISQLR